MVNDKTILHCVRIVVLADNKVRAAVIALTLNLGRERVHMVSGLALWACTTAGDTVLNHFIRNIDKHD